MICNTLINAYCDDDPFFRSWGLDNLKEVSQLLSKILGIPVPKITWSSNFSDNPSVDACAEHPEDFSENPCNFIFRQNSVNRKVIMFLVSEMRIHWQLSSQEFSNYRKIFDDPIDARDIDAIAFTNLVIQSFFDYSLEFSALPFNVQALISARTEEIETDYWHSFNKNFLDIDSKSAPVGCPMHNTPKELVLKLWEFYSDEFIMGDAL